MQRIQKSSVASLCERAVEVGDRGAPFPLPAEASDAGEIAKIAALIRMHLGAGASSAAAAEIGVLQHHANVPHGLRLSVEHAMKTGLGRQGLPNWSFAHPPLLRGLTSQ